MERKTNEDVTETERKCNGNRTGKKQNATKKPSECYLMAFYLKYVTNQYVYVTKKHTQQLKNIVTLRRNINECCRYKSH